MQTHSAIFVNGDEDAAEPRLRQITNEQLHRFEAYAAEIFSAFGMDLDTPATADTPRRFVRALLDATAGYDGDPKLMTVFRDRVPRRPRLPAQPGHRGADPLLRALRASRAALLRQRLRRLHRPRAHHRHLQADPAGPPVRPPLHRPGADRPADRRHAGGDARAARRRRLSGGAPPLHADAGRPGADSLTRTTFWRGEYEATRPCAANFWQPAGCTARETENTMTVVDRLFGWIADCGLGTRIDRFAGLFGVTMARSNGLMLERSLACCRVEAEPRQRRD